MTAIIEREDEGFVALCPELDVASQGSTIEEARANLIEALTLFFEVADDAEVLCRMDSDIPLHDSVRRGTLLSIIRQSELPKSLFESE
jgi:predicted RNase H-like HicB family nuclease